jgi:mono/diheme cytochrome c family protein
VARQESEGHKVFLAQHCNTCHAIQGSGGTLGPDLTHEGSRQTGAWILDQLNNPTSHKADSVMPSFAQLPGQEKEELAGYLVGLK